MNFFNKLGKKKRARSTFDLSSDRVLPFHTTDAFAIPSREWPIFPYGESPTDRSSEWPFFYSREPLTLPNREPLPITSRERTAICNEEFVAPTALTSVKCSICRDTLADPRSLP